MSEKRIIKEISTERISNLYSLLIQKKVIIFKELFKTVLDVFKSFKKEEREFSIYEIFDCGFYDEVSDEDNYEMSYYLYKIIKKLNITKSVLLCSFIFLDRIISNNREILNMKNLKYLTSTAIILSQKFLDDEVYKDKNYAETLNIKLERFIILESSFLKLINYELHITEKEFYEYCEYLLLKIKNTKE